jgi:hypothetical protein
VKENVSLTEGHIFFAAVFKISMSIEKRYESIGINLHIIGFG